MLDTILTKCDERYRKKNNQCNDCSYNFFCCHDCGVCLNQIHFPSSAPLGTSSRKYDCPHMADYYTCRFSGRYSSEIIHALRHFIDLKHKKVLNVLSFGCGPCTDLFAIDYMHQNGELDFQKLIYCGIDYSEDVWKNVHGDIKEFSNEKFTIRFYYDDMCEIISTIAQWEGTPDLVVFQYVFSDMHKHTGMKKTLDFISKFADYFNNKMSPNTYILLNDINLGIGYGGGREYFDILYKKLADSTDRRGRFHNDEDTSYYSGGYPYGEDSYGEFPNNANFFNTNKWSDYSPKKTCASAQMYIKKQVIV